MSYHSVNSQIIKEYFHRFPDLGSQTIAKLIYKEQQKNFKSFNSVYCAVRGLRGAAGKEKRRKVRKDYYSEEAMGKLYNLPESDTVDWPPFIIDGIDNLCIMADIHVPYHDNAAIESALRYCDKEGYTNLLLNGDIADCFFLSKFQKDPRGRRMDDERKMTIRLLEELRKSFKGRIYYKIGNHEERWQSYIAIKAPELYGSEFLDYANLYDFGRLGIELIEDKRVVYFDKLRIIHGHEYRFAISNPVNPARGLFLRAKTTALCDHFHQRSEHSENTLDGTKITTWSAGCLCDLHPKYMPLNNWTHGFACVRIVDDKFHLDNLKIMDGRIM